MHCLPACTPLHAVHEPAAKHLGKAPSPTPLTVLPPALRTRPHARPPGPEVRHHGSLTKASDVYALGVILWEMFEGRPCYQRVRGAKNYTYAAGFPTFAPLCPALYCHVATACMRKAPSERPTLVEVQQVRSQRGGGDQSRQHTDPAASARQVNQPS